MPKYLALIYGVEPTEQPSPQDAMAMLAEYNAYGELLEQRKAFVSGEALQPTHTATTVRNRDGQVLTSDGPFAETKEVIGGFYVLEATDLDEAIELAAACPGAKTGAMEVRPVIDFSQFG